MHAHLNFIFVFINLNSGKNIMELVLKHYFSIMAYKESINVNCLTIHVLNQMMYSNSFLINKFKFDISIGDEQVPTYVLLTIK